MAIVVLVRGREDGAICITVRRVRVYDHVAARVRTFALDHALASGATPDSTAALELRSETLIGPTERENLGRSVQQIVRRAQPGCRGPIHAAPLSRHLIRAAETDLCRLAERLLDQRPVSARGVASVNMLLRDGVGPLYGHAEHDGPALRSAVQDAIDALDITT